MTPDIVSRFAKLFTGNARSYGVFNPTTKKMRTEEGQSGLQEVEKHLTGKVGLGVVPIMDDSTCWFGAIDIDAHGDAPDIDIVKLEKIVRELDLPLVVCRSKSGGCHLYLFGSEPLNAALVRTALAKWADLVGYAGVEIFPKQSKLPTDNTGKQQLGNWLNLCMFDCENKDQLRYAIEGGRVVDIEYFLDLAESRRLTGAMLVERSDTDHNGAPPCIQRMITDGVGKGHRNEALYNMCLYLKQAYPETWRDKAFDSNSKIFTSPLSHEEAKKIIGSTARKDYRYKCGEEPCKSLCNSAVCVTRKYGITKEEKSELELGKAPEFKKLRKIETDPVKWIIEVENQDVVLTTMELADFRYARNKILEVIHRVLPPIKPDRWALILNALMAKCEVISAPDDASPSGVIRTKLQEFIRKTDFSAEATDQSNRNHLMLGIPVVQERDGKRVVYFRGTDFIDHLKKTRSEELKGPNMWMALRDCGVKHTKLRVSGTIMQVWYTPIDDMDDGLDPLEVKSEF